MIGERPFYSMCIGCPVGDDSFCNRLKGEEALEKGNKCLLKSGVLAVCDEQPETSEVEKLIIELIKGPPILLQCLGCEGLYMGPKHSLKECPFCGETKAISILPGAWPTGCLVVCDEQPGSMDFGCLVVIDECIMV